MSFSSPSSGVAPEAPAASGKSFGDHLMDYVGSKFPITGAALGAAGVHGNQADQSYYNPTAGQVEAGATPPVMPAMPDMSAIIQGNAQPKQSGLSAILKLLGVG